METITSHCGIRASTSPRASTSSRGSPITTRGSRSRPRLSEFLEPVSPQCDVAVLYPLRTVWTAGQLGEQASAMGEWARALTESRVGFHLVDERDLEAAAVEEGAV